MNAPPARQWLDLRVQIRWSVQAHAQQGALYRKRENLIMLLHPIKMLLFLAPKNLKKPRKLPGVIADSLLVNVGSGGACL